MTERGGFAGWSISRCVNAYRSRELSPVEVARWAVDEAERLNAEYGTVLTYVAAEEALTAARESETRWMQGRPIGPIDGVPATIKNLLAVRDWPLDFCSLTIGPDTHATFDAPAVARLREAGAVLLGYTSTPEFSWKLTTDSAKYGVTRNPCDPSRSAGGSSGGAAVAAAAGLAPFHIATDAAGSIRVPASFCGVFGMKPTFGSVAAYPSGPLTHVGVVARHAGDAATALDIIGRADARDWNNTPFNRDDAFSQALRTPLHGLRIAYAASIHGLRAQPEIERIVTRGVSRLADLGAEIVEAEPSIPDPRPIGRAFFSMGYVPRLNGMDERQLAQVDPGLHAFVEETRKLNADDLRQAFDGRNRLGSAINDFFADHDLLVTPTVAFPALPIGRDAPDGFPEHDLANWSLFTYIFNLAQNSAATIPCGTTASGLPVGLQIVGRKFDDARVLSVAHGLQQANDNA